MVHLNNVDAMKFMRLSKPAVEFGNIKQIVAKGSDNSKKSQTPGSRPTHKNVQCFRRNVPTRTSLPTDAFVGDFCSILVFYGN